MPVELKDSNIDSKYRLVIIASQRARKLIQGDKPEIESKHEKETSVAIEEVIENKIKYLTGKEAVIAQEEAIRLRDNIKQRFREDLMVKKIDKDNVADEIKRELTIYINDSKNKETESDVTRE